ncbi:hypothetical protein BGZ58_005072 [Dissophora ornata]|nr:hypothetical protein BGZ58_005072 [Dissophora ornata]
MSVQSNWKKCENQWQSLNPLAPSPSVFDNEDAKGAWPKTLPANIGYLCVTCYIALLGVVAVVMCLRARTRLRCFACACTYLGLSVAIVGLLRSKYSLPANFFWLWNFIAESAGITALSYAIVGVGNGFYPMAKGRNIFWKMAMALLILYAMVATANVIVYTVQKVVLQPISGAEIQALENKIIRLGVATAEYLEERQYMQQCMYLIPQGNLTETGVDNWKQLPWTLRDMFARPVMEIYITHQILMLITCVWATLYLFIPLVKNHRHGPIGQPLDSDMMAVGVWYLGCIMILTLAYAGLNIAYCFNNELIFKPQVQAVDLGIRTTISPVFLLPAPAFLIRFYRQHFKRFGRGGNSTRGFTGGKNGRDGANNGLGSYGAHNGSFVFGEGSTASPYSPGGSRLGHLDEDGSLPKVSLDDAVHLSTSNSDPNSQGHSSLGSAYGRIRLFHSRNRGTSSESNHVFNKDFEQEEQTEGQGTHDYNVQPDLHDHHYYGTPKDPIAGFRPKSMEPQRPEPVLIASGDGSKNLGNSWLFNKYIVGLRGIEVPPEYGDQANENFGAIVEKHELTGVNVRKETPENADATQGTTGWEVGGWGHVRQTSEGNENSASSPLEPPHRPHSAASGAGSAVVDIHGGASEDDNRQPAVSLEGLTGLQKQLAEYRSALLPVVLAMQDTDERDLSSAAFGDRDGGNKLRGAENDSKLRARPAEGFRNGANSNAPRPSSDNLSSSRTNYVSRGREGTAADTTEEIGEFADKDLLPVHSVDPLHWSKLSLGPKARPIFGGNDDYADSIRDQMVPNGFPATSTVPEGGDKPSSGFRRKWLASRKPGEVERPGPPKKPELELSFIDENKISKRMSSSSYIDAAQANKGGKAKDVRRGVFSKVLAGGGQRSADRGRLSQDINEYDEDYSALDSNRKTTGATFNNTPAPATVEALALASTIRFEYEDEDMGLQYYYPDPYYSQPEVARRQAALRDQPPVSPQRHPLSPTFSNDSMGPNADTMFMPKTTPPIGSPASKFGVANDPLALAIAAESLSSNSSARSPSIKTTKSTQSFKKPSKKDAAPTPAVSTGSNTGSSVSAPSSANPSHHSSLGSLLSRSTSNSKKNGTKAKSRGNRSKSDVPPTRTSEDWQPTPAAALPITATRKPSVPEVPAISGPAKTSLSPPPRQSWSRSKSFQGVVSPPALTSLNWELLEKTQDSMTVDTSLVNDSGYAGNAAPSSGTRSSLASSIGSPTIGPVSPALSPASEGLERGLNMDKASRPSSPPLSPPTTSFSRLGSHKSRAQDYRNASFEKEGVQRGVNSSTKDRSGFGRHQRSIDNLASAYYYKRAADLNHNNISGANDSWEPERERGSSKMMLSDSIIPPPSPLISSSGFSYYGIGTGGDESGRNSPAPYHYTQPQTHWDPVQYSSASYTPQLQKGKTSMDYSYPGSSPSLKAHDSASLNDASHTNGLKSLHSMADDAWTQAMVARAQNAGSRAGVGGGGNGGGAGSSMHLPYSHQQTGRNASPSPSLIIGPSGGVGASNVKGEYENGGGSSGGGGAYGRQNNLVRATSPLNSEFYPRPNFGRTGSE